MIYILQNRFSQLTVFSPECAADKGKQTILENLYTSGIQADLRVMHRNIVLPSVITCPEI